MPSPVKKYKKGKFYKREDGAWIKVKGRMKDVGDDNYPHRQHYSKRNIKRDKRRTARKSPKRKRYPQAYD